MSKKDWAKFPILPISFYSRDTVEVSRSLLGKLLFVRDDQKRVAVARIVETEAYMGNDPASHSAKGQTPRSSVMFEDPGIAYVYFIYGMYEMLNFVTHPPGVPGAVLIRSVEPISGTEMMFQRRKRARTPIDLTSGPGKLCQAMGVRLEDNRQSLFGPRMEVRDDGEVPGSISVSPRVGIRVGLDRFWRFFITGHPYVSQVPQNAQSILWKPKKQATQEGWGD